MSPIESDLPVEQYPLSLDDMMPTTSYLDPNEKVYWLVECAASSQDYSGAKRYQMVYVNRDDKIAVFVRERPVTDEDKHARNFQIPSVWEYSVAEITDYADAMRDENGLAERMEKARQESTLIKDTITLAEVRQQIKANRSQFGPAGTAAVVQRNGYHPRRK